MAPTFDGALFAWAVGHGGSDVVAVNMATGKERWRVARRRRPPRRQGSLNDVGTTSSVRRRSAVPETLVVPAGPADDVNLAGWPAPAARAHGLTALSQPGVTSMARPASRSLAVAPPSLAGAITVTSALARAG